MDNQLKLTIPTDVRKEWTRRLTDLTADNDIPVAIIMKVDDPHVEVFVKNDGEEDPYNVGDIFNLSGLYCEEVVDKNTYVIIDDARKDSRWQGSPALKQGLISYFGFPIRWPNGEIFGTLCLNDFEVHENWMELYDVVEEIQKSIESKLKEIHQKHQKIINKEEKED